MTRKKKTQNGSRLPALIIAVSAIVACFFLYMIVSTLITGAQEQSAFDELTAVVEQQREQADVPDSKPEQITSPVVTEPVANREEKSYEKRTDRVLTAVGTTGGRSFALA